MKGMNNMEEIKCPNCGAILEYYDEEEPKIYLNHYSITEYYTCPECQREYDRIFHYELGLRNEELVEYLRG